MLCQAKHTHKHTWKVWSVCLANPPADLWSFSGWDKNCSETELIDKIDKRIFVRNLTFASLFSLEDKWQKDYVSDNSLKSREDIKPDFVKDEFKVAFFKTFVDNMESFIKKVLNWLQKEKISFKTKNMKRILRKHRSCSLTAPIYPVLWQKMKRVTIGSRVYFFW